MTETDALDDHGHSFKACGADACIERTGCWWSSMTGVVFGPWSSLTIHALAYWSAGDARRWTTSALLPVRTT